MAEARWRTYAREEKAKRDFQIECFARWRAFQRIATRKRETVNT